MLINEDLSHKEKKGEDLERRPGVEDRVRYKLFKEGLV